MVRRRRPVSAVLVIMNRVTGYSVHKRIKNSAKTVHLVTQYHARHPDFFVYRVNVYEKGRP